MLEHFGANTSEYFINPQVLVLYPYSLHGNTFRGKGEKGPGEKNQRNYKWAKRIQELGK